jgi:hypothetical protein
MLVQLVAEVLNQQMEAILLLVQQLLLEAVQVLTILAAMEAQVAEDQEVHQEELFILEPQVQVLLGKVIMAELDLITVQATVVAVAEVLALLEAMLLR